ncbi:serine/threonine-protein phosphatase 1 regulatory subunit 10-like [Chanos chanos]|uniref:Serine/threonine-protein phosphatase 1 regulatory subunit 10-like n=1 Tax=Chanos chanos TaxID=29144 RepID=A0A6J2WMY1_CHACN|nr:serine/threonine-protein phosphatase 1 regulatory subunit 10-like [Chanos chanos]
MEEPENSQNMLKRVEDLLGKEGELHRVEEVDEIFKFIQVGGYRLLYSWLTHFKTINNIPLLQLILLTLQKLPLTMYHLKQNNTAKLVKYLSKAGETEDKNRKKEEDMVCQEVKTNEREKMIDEENIREGPEAQISNADFEVETSISAPGKKCSCPLETWSEFSGVPAVLRNTGITSSDAPELEIIHKPIDIRTSPDAECQDLTHMQSVEYRDFLSVHNSPPLLEISSKKKNSRTASPTYISNGKRRKHVSWAEEEQLAELLVFDLDKTERVNVYKVKTDQQSPVADSNLPCCSVMESGLSTAASLVVPEGEKTETFYQRDEKMHIPSEEICPTKESAAATHPHDFAESSPLQDMSVDSDCTTMEKSFLVTADSPDLPHPISTCSETFKLPPVLLNLLASISNPKTEDKLPEDNLTDNKQMLPSPIQDHMKQPDFFVAFNQFVDTLQQKHNPSADNPSPGGIDLHAPSSGVNMNSVVMQTHMNMGYSPNMAPKVPYNTHPPPPYGYRPPTNAAGGPKMDIAFPGHTGFPGHSPGLNMSNHNMRIPMKGSCPPIRPAGGLHYYCQPPPPYGLRPPVHTYGAPQMMGPCFDPLGHGADNSSYCRDDSMRQGPPWGIGQGGRVGAQSFSGRGGQRWPRSGHIDSHNGGMSYRAMCQFFRMSGSCPYGNNCAFYHPDRNGLPLPPHFGH